jgi:16S rRNA G966 N2-methylase RsmD
VSGCDAPSPASCRPSDWVLHEGDYAAACTISEPATWFIDPPYQKAGRHYRFGPDQIDYDELATWCLSRPGQVIVCENEGADWLPFQNLSEVKTTRAGRRSREVVWLSNFDQKLTNGRTGAQAA